MGTFRLLFKSRLKSSASHQDSHLVSYLDSYPGVRIRIRLRIRIGGNIKIRSWIRLQLSYPRFVRFESGTRIRIRIGTR